MEKKKVVVKINTTIIDKKTLARKVKKNINSHMDWFKKLLRQMDTLEKENGEKDDKV